MSKTTEALKLAEEALYAELESDTYEEFAEAAEKCHKALAAIREALAEPVKQEPVALSKTERDAKRYAYMMHPDFFEVCDVDSRVYRYKVGLQSSVEKGFPKPINQCIEGYGETLEAAIDMAIAAQQPVSEPVARVIVRPFNPMDASCPTTEVKWLKEPVPGFLYAAPVRTKDLTDDEVEDLATDWFAEEWAIDKAKGLIDDFLAKFKEKNTPPVVQQGEPVAWIHRYKTGAEQINTAPPETYVGWTHTPLYTTPPSVEAAIEATKEKAAKLCEVIAGQNPDTALTCAAAIRSMK